MAIIDPRPPVWDRERLGPRRAPDAEGPSSPAPASAREGLPDLYVFVPYLLIALAALLVVRDLK